jgi:transglutaminase-like putative cysteine protease
MNAAKRAEVGTVGIKEPIHLMAIRWPVYAGAAALAVGPIAPAAGMTAAIVGVTAGLWAGRLLAASKIRSVVIVAAALIVTGLGLVADRLVGGPAWFAGLLGYRGVLVLGEVLTFGLTAASLVAGMRAIATRHPSWGGVEAAAVAAIVVGTFAGHRDSHIGRPQFLSDWALSRGHDPVHVLLGMGLASALACALLLLRPQRPGRTIASVVALVGLATMLLLAAERWAPELPRNTNIPQDDPSAPEPKQPNPKPGQPPVDPHDPHDPGPPDPPPQPVAIVNLLDDLETPPPMLYFREEVQSELLLNVLVQADSTYDADVLRKMPTGRAEVQGASADTKLFQEVRQRISILMETPHPLGMVAARVVEPKPVADPKAFLATYQVSSRVPTFSLGALAGRTAGDPSWTSDVRNHYLMMPGDLRYKALAEKIISSQVKPEFRHSAAIRALALTKWIEANTTYSKHPKFAVDQAASFLFDGNPGKCTEVAHAMVFMLRSLGVPARAAGGYAAPSRRMGTGSALLLQHTDAHQWCEVYFEGVGWVVVDASPGRSITKPDPEPDPATQSRFAEKNREPEAKVVDQMQDEESAAKRRAWAPTVEAMAVLPPLLLVLAAVAIKAWRRLAPRWVSGRSLDRVGYRAILDRLTEVGLSRQFGETRGEFAIRVAKIVPGFVTATEAFDRRALTGEGGLDRSAWIELDMNISALIATAFPVRRRLLGLANPLAWRRAR